MTEKKGWYAKYFVLQPLKIGIHGTASRAAIIAYAKIIRQHDEQLANDLEAWALSAFANMNADQMATDRDYTRKAGE